MSKEKKIVYIFGLILVFIFLIIGFFVLYDMTQKQKLDQEVQTLIKLDITKDRYNTSIKSKQDYAVVEKAVKDYLDQYAVNLQGVLEILNASQLSKLLSVDNYFKDGPNFLVSRQYILETEKEFNEKIDLLIEESGKDKIRKYIEDKKLNSYYVDLYEKYMFNKEMTEEFLISKELLIQSKQKMNQIFTSSIQVFDFLQMNQGKWQIENKEIRFQTEEMVQQYNSFISQVK